MKPTTSLLASAIAMFLLASCEQHDPDHEGHDHADDAGHEENDGHDHGSAIAVGPNGGRLLAGTDPNIEFLVTPERTVQLTLLDGEGNAVAPGTHTVGLTTGDRSNPTVLEFVPSGNSFLSTAPLPEANNLATSIALKSSPDSSPDYARLQLDLNECPECEALEYVCKCDHH